MIPQKQVNKMLRVLKNEEVTMSDVAVRFGVVGPTVQRLAHKHLGPRVIKRVLDRCTSLRGERSSAARRRKSTPMAQTITSPQASVNIVAGKNGQLIITCKGDVEVSHEA